MERTDFVLREKNSVEPPEPYSQTDMPGRTKRSRKSIAAYENQGISRSSGVRPLRRLWFTHLAIYCGCSNKLPTSRPIFCGTVPCIISFDFEWLLNNPTR